MTDTVPTNRLIVRTHDSVPMAFPLAHYPDDGSILAAARAHADYFGHAVRVEAADDPTDLFAIVHPGESDESETAC